MCGQNFAGVGSKLDGRDLCWCLQRIDPSTGSAGPEVDLSITSSPTSS